MNRVIVYPRNGYINRLQAIASADLIARQLAPAEFIVCWEPQPAAGAPAEVLFSHDFCESHVRSRAEVQQAFGIDLDSLPRYLNIDAQHRVITLAGHDQGEQAFMPALLSMLSEQSELESLVFIAGGNFCLPVNQQGRQVSPDEFRVARGEWYRTLTLNAEIEEASDTAIAAHGRFIALHLRYTDRSHQAPSRRSIREALTAIGERTGVNSLFISSDTPGMRDSWMREAHLLGFEPWFVEHTSWDRSDPRSAHPALIDWRILGHSEAMVYFATSSFAHEAAVASGHFEMSIGLSSHRLSAVTTKARELTRAFTTYPRRHGWIGRG